MTDLEKTRSWAGFWFSTAMAIILVLGSAALMVALAGWVWRGL